MSFRLSVYNLQRIKMEYEMIEYMQKKRGIKQWKKKKTKVKYKRVN